MKAKRKSRELKSILILLFTSLLISCSGNGTGNGPDPEPTPPEPPQQECSDGFGDASRCDTREQL